MTKFSDIVNRCCFFLSEGIKQSRQSDLFDKLLTFLHMSSLIWLVQLQKASVHTSSSGNKFSNPCCCWLLTVGFDVNWNMTAFEMFTLGVVIPGYLYQWPLTLGLHCGLQRVHCGVPTASNTAGLSVSDWWLAFLLLTHTKSGVLCVSLTTCVSILDVICAIYAVCVDVSCLA